MLATPKFGWSQISIGDWNDRCSYLDDVPVNILTALDYVLVHKRPYAVPFDAEGYEYLIVFDLYETHIITLDKNDERHYRTIEVSASDLMEECICDIEHDLIAWSYWLASSDEEPKSIVESRRFFLANLCTNLRLKLYK